MFLVGSLAGALVVVLIWAAQVWLSSDDGATDSSATVAPDAAALFEPSSESPATTRLDRCHEVYDAQSGALTAAANSLGQWEVHIGAMNKLVTGAITLEQAQQFWDQTRVGAALKLQRFAAADRHFGRRTARCPEPVGSAAASQDLRSCAEAVADRNRTLRLAAVALETWRMHVHHMEMLRDGEMSAQEATQLWLQSWHQGNRQVMAYRAAARTADGKTC
jgi:hypothetical protein